MQSCYEGVREGEHFQSDWTMKYEPRDGSGGNKYVRVSMSLVSR